MKNIPVIVAAVALLALGAGSAYGQARAAGAPKADVPLKIEQLSSPGTRCLVPSPIFDGRVRGPNRNSGNKKKWAALEMEYVTRPEWIDSINVTFHVMTMDDSRPPAPHYFTTTVTYLDIAQGKHGACVMLPPSIVARYGTPVAFGVEVEVDDRAIGFESEGQGKGTKWWTSLDRVKNLVRHPGLLQDRSKTPFGLTHIDEYEAVR